MKNRTEQNITSELLKTFNFHSFRPNYFFNPVSTGLFLSFGAGADSPPLHNLTSIKMYDDETGRRHKTYKYVSFEVRNER